MYYYGYNGGFGYGSQGCCGAAPVSYGFPVGAGCGGVGYSGAGYGGVGYGAAIILVLFILLVIIIGARGFHTSC